MKILNVTLTVRDIAAAVKFYRDILEMHVDENTDHAVVDATLTPARADCR